MTSLYPPQAPVSVCVFFHQNVESWKETLQPQLAQRHLQRLRRVQPRALAPCAEASLQLTQVTTKTVSVLLLTVYNDFIYRGQYPLHEEEWVPHEHHCVSMIPILWLHSLNNSTHWESRRHTHGPDSTQVDSTQEIWPILPCLLQCLLLWLS